MNNKVQITDGLNILWKFRTDQSQNDYQDYGPEEVEQNSKK